MTNTLSPLSNLLRMFLHVCFCSCSRILAIVHRQHHTRNFFGRPVKLIKHLVGLRSILLKPFTHNRMNLFGFTIDILRILQKFQRKLGEHPVRRPAGHHNGPLIGNRLLQCTGHRRGRAWLQLPILFFQSVCLQGLIGTAHDAGTCIDSGNRIVNLRP